MKEELKKQIKQIKETTSSAKEHIEAFDTFFESEVAKRTNRKALEELFYNFIDLAYKHTSFYKFIIHNISDIDSKFRATLNDEQKELFDAYEYLIDESNNDQGLQAFIYGYALGQQLQIESNDTMQEILTELKKKLDANNL